MNLYERLRVLTVKFDVLNMEYERLNKGLRELLLEAGIEKDKRSPEYSKFKVFASRIKN